MFKHPKSVSMTYTEHLALSLQLSTLFFVGSVKAFIHAFYPDILENSSTEINEIITKKLKVSGRNKTTQTDSENKRMLPFWN